MKNKANFCANDYFNHESPVCREERQYALFLYNKLNSNDSNIMDYLNLKGKIVDTFYEATLMRDYWYWNKEEFNSRLREFIKNELDYQCEFDNIEQHVRWWKKCHPYARWMMHAKPDIAIISHYQDEYFLNFIECKYYSGISTYKDKTKEFFDLDQIELQKLILKFVCEFLRLKFKDSSKDMHAINIGKVIQVQFVSDNHSRRTRDDTYQIDIKQLLYKQTSEEEQ